MFNFLLDILKMHTKLNNFLKEIFYSMISLKSDKMTALWPGDSLTFTIRNAEKFEVGSYESQKY